LREVRGEHEGKPGEGEVGGQEEAGRGRRVYDGKVRSVGAKKAGRVQEGKEKGTQAVCRRNEEWIVGGVQIGTDQANGGEGRGKRRSRRLEESNQGRNQGTKAGGRLQLVRRKEGG
jgi:hypothetical protein